MKYFIIIIAFLFGTNSINAQSKESTANPTWKSISWMTGDWIGDGFGGVSYETWSAPIADIMTGTYRHVGDGKNTFFEFILISKKADGTFEMKLRHFNDDMTAWEDEKGHLIWPLNDHSNNSVTFVPCTYKLIAPGKMKITLLMEENGQQHTEVINFEKQ